MTQASPTLRVAEPSAIYLVRPPLVIDCSALAGLVFREVWAEPARARFHGRELHAPHLLAAEIASVSLKKLRRGEPHAEEGLAQALALDIDLHPVDSADVVALAQRYRLSAYDACYLWLAADLKCALATFDDLLADAAQAHLAGLP